ncbi:serine--tRNA synthetase-like protein Slimp [Zerene cesonia]|uniref:serine--tRNA synthetase-like protein Slimp n=1 Tax=Zerene cesonia TaxID=33412 RepID=UPI0018E5116C|nr:serine--tRNA synthetase-like protein Slimp [Zerene cesonia]
MLLKSISKILHKTYVCNFLPHRYSALFINGLKATENFVFLLPHIDFPDRLSDKDVLLRMLNKRKSNFDVDKLENLWNVYIDLKKHKTECDNRRNEYSKQLNELYKHETEGNKIEKLKIQVNLIKENLKNLKAPLWAAEEAAIVEALHLPNSLHNLTPDNENKLIYQHKQPPKSCKNHSIIGQEQNLLMFMNNNNYYLTGDAALFELGAKFYFSNFLKSYNFIQFSCPDFVKSLIVEGCGIDHTDPNSTFILHDNENSEVNADKRMHLTGAGSLCAFFAYHAKNVIYSKLLPLQYFSMGRLYAPRDNKENTLFNVSQSSVVQMFVATKDGSDLDAQLNNVIEIIKNLYSKLDYHFRLVYVAADKLHNWESLRVSIEMYSSSLKEYIEIGNVSLSGDYISKRLMFTYTENKQNKFPHILSGTILNVPKFLGCVLEQDADFVIPQPFKVENWKQKTIC